MSRILLTLTSFLAVQAVATRAFADITTVVNAPTPNQVEGAVLSVAAHVTSTYAIQSVVAESGGVTQSLSPPSLSGQPWTGTLTIASLSYGNQTLNVTVTDAIGTVTTTAVPYRHHNPPTIDVTSPVESATAHPSLTISATCSDDTGCLYLPAGQSTPQPGFEVDVAGQVYTTSTNSLTQTIDLSTSDGQLLNVVFKSQNVDGLYTVLTRHVNVDVSPRLSAVATVPGTIFDFDSSRVLYRRADDTMVIRDRGTQADTIIGKSRYTSYPPYGSLTSAGAVWVSSDPATSSCAFSSTTRWYWNGAGPTQFDTLPDCDTHNVDIAGDWIQLRPYAAPTSDPMSLQTLNLVTGAIITHNFPVTRGNTAGSALLRSGDLYLISGGDPGTVYRSAGGVITTVGTVPSIPRTAILADETSFVFGGGGAIHRYVLADGTSSSIVSSSANFPTAAYQASHGWVGYHETVNNVQQVFAWAPDGTQAQRSVFNVRSSLDAVAPSGEIMFKTSQGADAGTPGERYLSKPSGGLPERVGSALGTGVSRCDGWSVMMGGTLFRVTGTEDSGVACPPPVDAGAPADAAEGTDAQAGSDSGAASDAGTASDSGTASDAGAGDATIADGSSSDASSQGGGDGGQSGGCSTGSKPTSGTGAGALALAGLALMRRRRRRLVDVSS